MKIPLIIELALKYCGKLYPNIDTVELDSVPEYSAFIAGCEAIEHIIEEELKLIEEQRSSSPGLGGICITLKSILNKLS